MKTLEQILEGVTAGGKWTHYTTTLSKGAAKGEKRLAGFGSDNPRRSVMHANWTLSEGDVWEAWITCKEPDYLYAARACSTWPELVKALEGLTKFSVELCEDTGISANYPSIQAARAALDRALKD